MKTRRRYSFPLKIDTFMYFTEEEKKVVKSCQVTPALSCLLLLSNSRLKFLATTYQPLFASLYSTFEQTRLFNSLKLGLRESTSLRLAFCHPANMCSTYINIPGSSGFFTTLPGVAVDEAANSQISAKSLIIVFFSVLYSL